MTGGGHQHVSVVTIGIGYLVVNEIKINQLVSLSGEDGKYAPLSPAEH